MSKEVQARREEDAAEMKRRLFFFLSTSVNVIRGANGGRRWGGKKGNSLQQRYLPNAWSRKANTAAVMTEKENVYGREGGSEGER